MSAATTFLILRSSRKRWNTILEKQKIDNNRVKIDYTISEYEQSLYDKMNNIKSYDEKEVTN